ncbi:DUF1080 domain-containing protein [Verrucomicrobiales bacterium]|nr:DUF1080 domain-containing protein [Verrucomicrobiales bacterium]MDB4358761.1 DUF1080 domain-containing protein [Verrucomicrobiales bacterium]
MRPKSWICRIETVLVAIASLGLFAGSTFSLQAEPFETVLFEDDFEDASLKKEWGSWKSESLIRDGVLVGITPKTADHPSVNTVKLPPLSDLEVAVSFKFAGSNKFNIMFRDLDYEGSHAGHICHVVVGAQSIDLVDGKTGQFLKSIRDLRKAGIKPDAATLELLKTKVSHNEISIDSTTWHDLVIRIEGDVIKVWIDGELAGTLKSEGIAHTTKSNMNITTMDREVHYDNFVIRTPEPK